MGRTKRIWHPDEYYHVYIRGNRKEGLFRQATDYDYFLEIVERAHKRSPVEVTSFCLMKTHYHLQIRSKQNSISDVMKYINRVYALYYNHKYRLRGPVFLTRFSSKAITDQRSMLHVSRYIHQNPVSANITPLPEKYKWSSYSYYLNQSNPSPPSFLTLTPVLDSFSGSTDQKIQKYIEWCQY